MQRKILLSGIAAILLAGFSWAEDPKPAQTLSFGFAAGGSDEMPADPSENPGPPERKSAVELFFQGDAPNFNRRILPTRNVLINDMPNSRAPGEYWLGIGCYPAMPVLRVHLNLPEKQGLVVNNVAPESPAAKAGIEVHDILMQAGEKKLTNVGDLFDVVESAKETPLKLEIIHAGKPKSVEVTPAKRPQNAMFKLEGKMDGAPANMKEFQAWVQKLQSGNQATMPNAMAFRFIGPGTILPPGSPDQPPMPKNMSINISRDNDKPAEITVKWGDKKWEINEEKLDELPDDVRPFVERMLGQAKHGAMSAEAMNFIPDFTIPAPPPGAQGPQMQVRPFKSVEQQLEELNRKIDKMQKELQEKHGDKNSSTQSEEEKTEAESDQPETLSK